MLLSGSYETLRTFVRFDRISCNSLKRSGILHVQFPSIRDRLKTGP